jgi:hypothetical protein
MDEIRAVAVEGCRRLVRGGLEVGGVLVGTRQGEAVTIQAFRNSPIVYALGPAFLLSAQDRAAFAETARAHETDPDLKGMVPVGWFVSHSRSDSAALTDSDAAIFDEFFKEPWQTTLVLRPERSGKARAAFFTRTGRSGSEFDLAPAAPAREVAAPAPETAAPRIVAATIDPPRSGGRFALAVWVISAFIMGAAASAGYFYGQPKASPPPPPPALGLTVSEEGQTLLLAWNPAAVTGGDTATIEVKDSGGSRLLHLTRPQLARGAYPLAQSGDDVSFRVTAYDNRGSIVTQANTRFIGPPTGPSPELEAARGEAERLRVENAELRNRLKTLEERSRVLEKILQSEHALKPH